MPTPDEQNKSNANPDQVAAEIASALKKTNSGSQPDPVRPGPRLVQPEGDVAIPKPDPFAELHKFMTKRDPTIGGVATLLTALPHYPLPQAKDFVRLHPDREQYWSPECCFVNVPIKGMKRDTLHMIDEDIALRHLPGGDIQRFRLVLATKPHDAFFLCHVPTQNLDNSWNLSNLTGCEEATRAWVKMSSRKAEGVDSYVVTYAQNEKAFPPPKWPTQTLMELIKVTFQAPGLSIETEDHPGLLRLIGAVQAIT
jgi:hypothetical protein